MLWEAKWVTFPSLRRVCSLLSWQPAEKAKLQISPSPGGGESPQPGRDRAASMGVGRWVGRWGSSLRRTHGRPAAESYCAWVSWKQVPAPQSPPLPPCEFHLALPNPACCLLLCVSEKRDVDAEVMNFSNTVKGKTLRKLGPGYLHVWRKLYNGSRVRPEAI